MTARTRGTRPPAASIGRPAAEAAVPWRPTDGGLRLSVRLTPKAARDAIGAIADGPDGLHLAVKVRALPSEGAANAALEKLIARWLGLPQRDVSLAAGGKSRLKSLHLTGDPGELAGRLRDKLGHTKSAVLGVKPSHRS